MSTRALPGAYVSLNDLSQFPEGATSLVVGYVLKANRGPVNEATLVTSPTDFLTKFTLSGKPSLTDDPTFWSILRVLNYTNQMYVVRAAVDPKFGGVLIKAPVNLGIVSEVSAETKTITVRGEVTVNNGDVIVLSGTGASDGYYTVAGSSQSDMQTSIIVEENISANFEGEASLITAPVVPVENNIDNPEAFEFSADTLMLITGKDAGAYNGKLSFEIISAVDNPDALVYHEGANIGGVPCEFNTMQLVVRNAETNETLESFIFSRDVNAKEIDGTSLFVENVVANSAYIKVVNNANIDGTLLPFSTLAGSPVQAGAGSDGGEVTESALVGALNIFADKTIPISILGNGCSPQAESVIFQQAMMGIADQRQDILCVLNSRKADETAALNSVKAQNVVTYKKDLGSTSFFGCMYAPHVNITDSFNNRQVKIGCDAVAISGWLNVISNLNYPYAYAGPRNGLVSGVTCDWKIGDESGEATILNDASVNCISFDGKQSRYYMLNQNTLQVANSAMRNIGGVLNVLDIKEHLATSLKEYVNLPITDTLRRDILNACRGYLSPMEGTRFYNYEFSDVTTGADIAQDTLRYLLSISITRYSQRIYCAINVVNGTLGFSILQSA